MLDRAAGTVVTHNYMVAAGQWLTAPSTQPPVTMTHTVPQLLPAATTTAAVAPGLLRAKPRPLRGVDDVQGVVADNMGDYEHLHGVVADNMGAPDDINAPDELAGYERLQGIAADVGAPDDVGGPDDVSAPDDMGDADHVDGFGDPDVGEEEIHGPDDFGDLGFPED
jgi:hypothetical protein